MIWKTRKMSGGLTRRAQDHGDVEKGDPECAGWTSPKTQTLCYPTWIHSSGSAFKRSPCWTSTTQKCLSSRASQEKKEKKNTLTDPKTDAQLGGAPELFSQKKCGSLWGKRLLRRSWFVPRSLLCGAPLSLCLSPHERERSNKTSAPNLRLENTWSWLTQCRHRVFNTGTTRRRRQKIELLSVNAPRARLYWHVHHH